MPGLYKPHAEAGTLFHQIFYPSVSTPPMTYWCAPLKVNASATPSGMVSFCLISADIGDRLVLGGAQPWLSDAPDPDGVPSWQTGKASFSLDESEDDLIGPMNFNLIMKTLTSSSVTLEAQAIRDGHVVILWDGVLGFDKDGRTVLPFWTHRLALTRNGASVTAAFTPDGDGRGWPAAKLKR